MQKNMETEQLSGISALQQNSHLRFVASKEELKKLRFSGTFVIQTSLKKH